MNKRGSDVWCEICDSTVPDADDGIIDMKRYKKVVEEDGSWGMKFDMLKPYKKIDPKGMSHFAKEVVSLAAMSERKDGHEECISVTFGPVYHFFNEDVIKRFMDRVHDIIEAAKI